MRCLLSERFELRRCHLAVALAASALAAPTARADEPSLDPYRACYHQVAAAVKGDALAQHTCFVAAYVRVNDPNGGGEDTEGINRSFSQLLEKLGDARFAQALKLERPEIIAAVGYFLDPTQLKTSPTTQQLIRSAPKIIFPLERTIRGDKSNPLFHRLYPSGFP